MATVNSTFMKKEITALKELGISYKKISELSGVNYSSIRNLMCGYRDGLSENNYFKLEKFIKKYEPVINDLMEVEK